MVEAPEECDDGLLNSDTADCTSLCLPAACGDGLLHQAGSGTEECDNGPGSNGPGQACKSDCTLNVCGDNDQGPIEGCDDGNAVDGDGCTAGCELESCGNLTLDVGEDCDDGQDGDNDDGCTDLCTFPACGDAFVQLNCVYRPIVIT